MAPVALFRSLCFWGAIIGYGARRAHAAPASRSVCILLHRGITGLAFAGLFVNVLAQYVKDNDRRRHAILVPVTRVATSTLLWICGYTVRHALMVFVSGWRSGACIVVAQVNVTGRANLVAAQRATAAQNGAFIIVRTLAAAKPSCVFACFYAEM